MIRAKISVLMGWTDMNGARIGSKIGVWVVLPGLLLEPPELRGREAKGKIERYTIWHVTAHCRHHSFSAVHGAILLT
jgi:hypothetical protein